MAALDQTDWWWWCNMMMAFLRMHKNNELITGSLKASEKEMQRCQWFCSLSGKGGRIQELQERNAPSYSAILCISMFHSFATAWQDHLFTMKAAQNETDSGVTQKGSKGCPQECKDRAGCIAIVAQIPWSAPYFYIDHTEPVIKFTSWAVHSLDILLLLNCSSFQAWTIIPREHNRRLESIFWALQPQRFALLLRKHLKELKPPFSPSSCSHKPPIYCIYIYSVCVYPSYFHIFQRWTDIHMIL